MMAGVMLVAMGLAGLGSAVRFIPRPVVVGFTNGIAVLIASTQLRDFFGLQVDRVPGEFWPRMVTLVEHASSWSPTATVLGATVVVAVVAVNRLTRVPGAIVALIASTAAASAMKLHVETIGTRFGGIPQGLPSFAVPHFKPELLPGLLVPALTVAMLGAIESLMSATVADRMSGDRHNSNTELVAQGIANIVSPLVGGLPATGAIARTATNIRSGARTPIAGMVHAVTLFLILIVAAPLAGRIPLAVLAGLLLVVSWNMGEWLEIPELLRLTKTDISVWVVTFALTVFADLTVAVEVGMVLAALLFILRVADTTTVTPVTEEYLREGHAHILQDKAFPPYVKVFRIHGPFLFGATEKLRVILDHVNDLPPIVVIRLRNMTALDGTGLRAFEELADGLHTSGREVIFCGAKHQPAQLMARADFHRRVGDQNVCANIQEALDRARWLHHQHPGNEPYGMSRGVGA